MRFRLICAVIRLRLLAKLLDKHVHKFVINKIECVIFEFIANIQHSRDDLVKIDTSWMCFDRNVILSFGIVFESFHPIEMLKHYWNMQKYDKHLSMDFGTVKPRSEVNGA